MCGIIGLVSFKPIDVYEKVVNGLKRLEYRGYDSAGAAFLTNDGSFYIVKDVGKVGDVFTVKPNVSLLPIGIGHTRWATHGGVTRENAHPHTDDKERVAIVHNGIIENYSQLKSIVIERGHKIVSDTDTEIVAHLLADEIESKGDVLKAIQSVMDMIRGSYAIVVLVKGESDKLYFFKKDIPLLIGFGDGAMFIASDVSAFLGEADKFVPLQSFDYGYITGNGIKVFNRGTEVFHKPVELTWDADSAEKQGYAHFMEKEIHEQVYTALQTFHVDVSNARSLIDKFNVIHITGAGTSYNAGLVLNFLIEKDEEQGKCISANIASEYMFRKRPNENTLLISITQSGETADTLMATRFAKSRGAKVIGITNINGSSITQLSDEVLLMNAGLEIGVAATKTFLSQLIIAEKLAGLSFSGNDLKSAVEEGLSLKSKAERVASSIKNAKSIFFLGRGLSYALAKEGALKLKEISYIHAEAYPGGELKHGPISLIERDIPVFVIAPNDETFSKTIANVEEVEARGAKTFILTNTHVDEKPNRTVVMFKSKLWEYPTTIFMQLVAYYAAVMLGRDPDKPRNLAKSVTVE